MCKWPNLVSSFTKRIGYSQIIVGRGQRFVCFFDLYPSIRRVRQLKAILVEDDPLISTDLVGHLSRQNVETVAVYESSNWLQDNPSSDLADVIITNLQLSDGWADKEYFDLIRRKSKQVIILTGLADQAYLRELDPSGQFSYCLKPFNQINIRRALGRLDL